VLSENPKMSADLLKGVLKENGVKKVKIVKHEELGEIIAAHYEIRIGDETVCMIYEPLECHSYNDIILNKHRVKIASIDTILSFYLAFLYSDRPYYDDDRILCMCDFLFQVQEDNRLSQDGLLRRFGPECYGKQTTLSELREAKSKAFQRLKGKKGTKEYEEWFFKYYAVSQLH
jgi:hypothetical protein